MSDLTHVQVSSCDSERPEMASGARSEKALGGDVGHRREAGDGESMRGSWGERTSAGDAPVRLGRR